MPASVAMDAAGTLRRSLFPALAWAFTCALACPLPAQSLPAAESGSPSRPDSAFASPSEPRGALTLDRALDLAIQHSLAVRERLWSSRAEAARAREEARTPNPTLEGSIENFGGGLDASREERTLSLAQELDLGGRRRALGAVARGLDQQRSVALEVERRSVLRRTAEAFLDVWRLEHRVPLLAQAERIGQAAIAAARERTRIGAAPVTEALRAEGEWAQRGIERRNAEAELAIARRALAQQWGARQASFDSLVLAPPDSETAAESDRSGALAAHPEARMAASELAVSAARLRAAQAARIPELTALGGVRHLAEDDANGLTASLSAPIPLWNRGADRVAAAQADQRAAEAHQAAVRLELERQLAEARERQVAARETYDLARRRAQPATQKALAQLESGYRQGRFSYLDYLDGQRSALDIQLAALDAERDYWSARLEVERLTGATHSTAPQEDR